MRTDRGVSAADSFADAWDRAGHCQRIVITFGFPAGAKTASNKGCSFDVPMPWRYLPALA